MDITLEQLLASRDARVRRQQELLEAWPDATLLCLTVIMPGPCKRSETSLRIASAAVSAIRSTFDGISVESLHDLETGYEGYFLLPQDPLSLKRTAVTIEDTHPWGRLFDIDVITPSGPISRNAIGAPERRCLLCERPARLCMRERRHSYAELLAAIETLVR